MVGIEEAHRREEQGQAMRRQRQGAGVGLRDLARALNRPHSFLSQVETGKTPAPAWLAEVYSALAAGTDLASLIERGERTAGEPDSSEHLLSKRLAVDEELVIALSAEGYAERYLHRLHLRALSTAIPGVVVREVDADQLTDLSAEALEGGKVAIGRRISGRVDLGVKFAIPLDRREEHFVTLLIEPPPGETHFVRWPNTHYGLRRFAVRLWRPSSDGHPSAVGKVSDLEPHEPVPRLDYLPKLIPNANGLISTSFTKLRLGFGYGLTWQR